MRTLVSTLTLLAVVALTAADDLPAEKKAPPAKKDDTSLPAEKKASPAKKDDTPLPAEKKTPPSKQDDTSLPAEKKAPPAQKEDTSPKEGAPLKVGKDLPATFHPYNVTGPHKEHFHCLISEHGLDPMVMIFYKGVDFGEPLPDLVKRLDSAIESNPNRRLGAFVVFVPEDVPDVVGSSAKEPEASSKNDDARLELAKKIDGFGSDNKLKHVVLCLDSKSDVAKFDLSPENLVTVVLYTKLKVAAVYALPKSEFTGAAVDKIMTDVAEKLGAKRK